MGLYCFPGPRAEGMLPVLLINTVVSVVLLKNTLKSLFVLMGVAAASSSNSEEDLPSSYETTTSLENSRARRVSISRYGSLCRNRCSRRCCINARKRDDAPPTTTTTTCTSCGGNNGEGWPLVDCCVCLCRFELEEEVSELSCKHFFHKGCLEKWFGNQHSTCPLCRSVM